MLPHGIPTDFRGGVFIFIETAMSHWVSPEFNGSRNHVPTAFTSKVVPVTGVVILQVTMDQLMCASLFPHPLWYEVGMLIEYDPET